MPTSDAFFAKLRSGTSRRGLRQEAQVDLDDFVATPGNIEFPPSDAPEISVIVVLFNQAELTYRCLQSLQIQAGVAFEVIIVDNASSDRTAELLAKVRGAKIISNSENQGFLLAVNQAANQARGDHLTLLNNDAFPLPGALARAAWRLRQDDGIGIVGARIVLPSGRLQEAGTVVWRDAKAIGFGAGRRPDQVACRIERDVDYVCGAFLTTRRAVFEQLNGFDEVFLPAYYEEMDFCFRARAAGHRVLYDPGLKAVHLNFGSSSLASALKRMMTNRRRMVARHKSVLRGRASAAPWNYLKAIVGRNTGAWTLIVEPGARAASARLAGQLLDAGQFATVARTRDLPSLVSGGFWAAGGQPQATRGNPAGALAWRHFDTIVLNCTESAEAVADAIPPQSGKLHILVDRQATDPPSAVLDILRIRLSGNRLVTWSTGDPLALVEKGPSAPTASENEVPSP